MVKHITEHGRGALRGLQTGGRLRMAIVLWLTAGALTTTRPEAAAIILGTAERPRRRWTGTKRAPAPLGILDPYV
jgi:hypothetical protein